MTSFEVSELNPFWKKLFAGSLKGPVHDPYLIVRLQSVFILSFTGMVALIIFGFINLAFHARVAGYYELATAAVLGLNLVALNKWGNVQLSTNIILGILTPLLIYLVHTGGIAGSGIVWLFVIAPVAYYLVGLRWGTVWVGLTGLGLAVEAYLQYAGIASTAYDLVFLRQAAACLAVVAVIIYFHEKVSDKARLLVAERTRREAELNVRLASSNLTIEEAQTRYQALVESIGDGIIAVDAEGMITLANQAAQEMLKLKSDKLVGKTIDVFRVEDQKGNKVSLEDRVISRVLNSNKKITTSISTPYYYVDSTGHRFPVASTQSPIIIDGKNQGAVCVFRDISHEEQIDQAKTELVSLASHQLNTPLTAVNWYTEMLLSGEAGKLAPTQQQYLQEIYSASSKMVDLVNDFLNASRIEMGTFVSQYQPVNVIDIVEGVLGDLSPTVIRKKISVVRRFDKLPLVELDKRLIQIVMQNLLSNAVKYTLDRGSITVDVSFKGSRSSKFLKIIVADTGLGIPKSEQPNIFHKMYRAQNAKHYEAEGTGLGLYIVKSAVEQMHGVIELKSEEGRGTTFTVEIPLSSKLASKPAAELHKRGSL